MLAELRRWVELETPTADAPAVNRLMDLCQAGLSEAGARVQRVAGQDGFGDNLLARIGPEGGKHILVAGHLDTVWPTGTLKTMPFRVEGAKAHGPGIYDMKAGSFLAYHSVVSLLRQKVATPLPIVLLLTPDEEVGSPTSRALIEQSARDAAYVLIPEPAAGVEGAAVTARKGVGRFVLKVRGRAAHSGGNFSEGRSAIDELAAQILAIKALRDIPAGITTNVGPVWGGTVPNVIAQEAGCEIDLRVATAEQGERLAAAIHALRPHDPDCRLEITGQMNRPPFDESPGVLALYETARALAQGIGFALPKQHRGGGSDGNFTAVMGVPTLDGLGCVGAGAHADHEHILWESLEPRAKLMLGLLETLH